MELSIVFRLNLLGISCQMVYYIVAIKFLVLMPKIFLLFKSFEFHNSSHRTYAWRAIEMKKKIYPCHSCNESLFGIDILMLSSLQGKILDDLFQNVYRHNK